MLVRYSVGEKIGKRTLIGEPFKDNNGHVMWNTRCECGKETAVAESRLIAGRGRQCPSCASKQRGKELAVKKARQNCERDSLIVDLYNSGMNVYEVGDIVGVTHETVRVVCVRNGIIRGSRKKYHIKEARDSVVVTVGQEVNNLTVLSERFYKKDRGKSQPYRSCKCRCGNVYDVVEWYIGYTIKCRRCSNAERLGRPQNKPFTTNPGDTGFRWLVRSYRANAAQRNLEWTLSEDRCRVLFKSNCFYCGISPAQKCYGGGSKGKCREHALYIYNGLDRLINSIGYVGDNVVACCGICNHAKHVMDQSEFEIWILFAAEHIKKRWEDRLDTLLDTKPAN